MNTNYYHTEPLSREEKQDNPSQKVEDFKMDRFMQVASPAVFFHVEYIDEPDEPLTKEEIRQENREWWYDLFVNISLGLLQLALGLIAIICYAISVGLLISLISKS